jgi:PRC-barrel domain
MGRERVIGMLGRHRMKKVAFMAAALVLEPLPTLSQEAQRSETRAPSTIEKSTDRDQQGGTAGFDFRSRLAEAIETVTDACADDIEDFCGKVSPGAGRLAMCMRAHEDQFSRGCRATLERVSSNIEHRAHRVTEMCWNEVRELCGDTDRVGHCVVQKKESLSAPCQTIVTILGQRVQGRVQGLMAQVGMPVYSSDDKALGQVAQVVRAPDGKIQSIQVDIGRILGLGTKVVTITHDKFEQLAGIKLRLSDAEIRSLPEAKK